MSTQPQLTLTDRTPPADMNAGWADLTSSMNSDGTLH